MKRILPVIALSLLTMAAPARAADLAQLDCVANKLDPATQDMIAKDVEHNLKDFTQRSRYSLLVVSAVNAAGADCARDYRWTPAATRAASLYTLAKFSLPVAQRVVAERGLDPSELESLWFALPEEQRNKPLTAEGYRTLADAAIPEGEQRTQANGALLHTFFEFESILQYASLDFSAA